jgi:hypothetical protein
VNKYNFGVVFSSESAESVASLPFEEFTSDCRVAATLRVSCPFGEDCLSPSRRDQSKRRAWLCGSDFSHVERLSGCIEYCRRNNGMQKGERANRGGVSKVNG